MQYDFGGYATRNDIRCTDGRTIRKNAFKDNNGQIVPLVWQHNHDSPENVLGHGLLENRDDGVYVYGTFNDSEAGRQAKELVQHGDITRLSIYANRLKENDHNVVHGNIREVSLVFAGANDGAYIDKVAFQHSDDSDPDEAIIYSGEDFQKDVSLDIFHSEDGPADAKAEEAKKEEPKVAEKERTIGDVVDEMTDEQRKVLEYLVGVAASGGAEGAADEDEEDEGSAKHYDYGDDEMKYNVFEEDNKSNTLMHKEDIKELESAIFADARRCGSLKESYLAHAEATGLDTEGFGTDDQKYGIQNIDIFFPEVKNLSNEPNMIQRDAEWVSTFMNGTKKSPFSRIKVTNIDITKEAARALGYTRGKRKKEEVILALKRTTEPTTIYKKQGIDHQDLIDITDFRVVDLMKREMRAMLNEEVARAALIGDGRNPDSDDKIDETKIRPIVTDDETYSVKVPIVTSDKEPATASDIIDTIIRSRKFYKGSGNPIMFTTEDVLADLLLTKDDIGHYLYKSVSELATVLRVKDIVTVPVLENCQRKITGTEAVAGQIELYKKATSWPNSAEVASEVIAIIVNPADYTFGSDNGSDIEYFDDFDIDFNQHKYLMETRCSGSLTKPFSALVIEKVKLKDGEDD